MNVRDLAPGTLVALVHNSEAHARDHIAPQGVVFLGIFKRGYVLETRGQSEYLSADDPDWYIADPRTQTAYTFDDGDPVLIGPPPELE